MARKTAEVDALLSRIANELEEGRLPSLVDANDLDILYSNYLEYNGSKLASELGLRDGNNVRNGGDSSAKKLDQDFINALVAKKMPHQSHAVILAYLNKKITVRTLFGEKDRKIKSQWQMKVYRGELVQRCLDNIQGLNCNHFAEYGKNNVFTLLIDILEKDSSPQEIVKKHPVITIEQFEAIKQCISDEKQALSDCNYYALHNTTRDVFIDDFKFYKERCDRNLKRR